MKIFIQIASYRDPELIPTIKSCLENAKNPENLVFGICRQYHPEDEFDDLRDYENDKRFKIINVLYSEAKGVCWARNQVQQLYNDEDYTLQIDSHMRFEKNWDETLIDMLNQLKNNGVKKPLLTTYVPSYNPNNDPNGRVKVPWRMVFDKFSKEGVVLFLPEIIPNWDELKSPVPSRFYSAHFCFTTGEFSKEVQHDPNFYFHGEEISIAVRAFTNGYEMFHPHKVVIWHEYTRNGRTKHWDDQKNWYILDKKSHILNKNLLGVDGSKNDYVENKYGLGTMRTLRDYEKYAGIFFEKRLAHKETIEKKYPPNSQYENDEEWIKSFSNPFSFEIKPNPDDFLGYDFDFFAITFHDEEDNEIFRKDADKIEIKEIISKNIIKRAFHTLKKPKSWSIWLHSEKEGWIKQLKGEISYE
jgi:hypothetical protein